MEAWEKEWKMIAYSLLRDLKFDCKWTVYTWDMYSYRKNNL